VSREPPENKALQRLKTPPERSHNRTTTKLEEKLVALVKALARQAAERDYRAERERENGRVQ
jgi:primosomal protein N''